MKTNDPLPCPFCGSQSMVRTHADEELGPMHTQYDVWCTECFCQGPAFSEKACALDAWNKRSNAGVKAMTTEQQQSEIERAKFEVWHKSHYGKFGKSLQSMNGRYCHSDTRHEWLVWLASIQSREWKDLTHQEFEAATSGLEDLEDYLIEIQAKLKDKNNGI